MKRATAAALLACLLQAAAAAAELTAAAWKADLDFLARELPVRHRNLFWKLPRRDFEAQVRKISETLPGMNDAQIQAALVRLVASAGNGHTWIEAFRTSDMFPIRFRQFADGYYAVQAAREYRQAIGARLTGIGELGIEEVKRRLLPLVPRETEFMEAIELPQYLHWVDPLRGTGIVGEGDEAAFRFENGGAELTIAIHARPVNRQGVVENRPEGASYETPLYLSDRQKAYWFRYLAERRALYIQYNSCTNMNALSFADFTVEAMQAADENPVEKVIIDLRHNTGGNSQVIQPLVTALKKRPALCRKGRLFVLTSNSTFSSGLMAMLQLKRELGARTVGEPSAQRPNTYGDVRKFQLPNSGLMVAYPIKYFRLAPGDPPVIQPDITVELLAHDYFTGWDPVLAWVLTGRAER
jgi:hypothetical protein